MTMVGSKVMKRTTRKNKNKSQVNDNIRVPILESIPIELVTEIVARVAASSSDDYFNAKLSCKALNKVADDKYVFRHVSLEKFPVVSWKKLSEEASSFLNRCTNSGNPEALYRRGVIEYFGNMEMDSAIRCLWRAANSGHLGALYVTGIILLLQGDEFQRAGMKIISDMKKLKNTRRVVRECRENLKRISKNIWKKNPLLLVGERARPTCCTTHDYGKSVGWTPFEDVSLECEACMCDQEIASITEELPNSF